MLFFSLGSEQMKDDDDDDSVTFLKLNSELIIINHVVERPLVAAKQQHVSSSQPD